MTHMNTFLTYTVVATALASLGARSAHAQGDTTATRQVAADTTVTAARAAMDSAFERARRLVMSGQTMLGRQVGDSILAATHEGTEAYGEALYGLARLAPTASDAAVDYQRIIVEYPFSGHAGDALLQLAQLERSRGDRVAAIAHLQRYLRENPTSPKRATTGLWLAQLLFEQSEDMRACDILKDARAAANPADVELQNQMNFYSGRCAAAAVQTAADSTAHTDSIKADSIARADALKRRAKTGTAGPRAAKRPAPRPTSDGWYAVQLGAYRTRAQAERLAQTLHGHGIEARVEGDREPFRVRVGQYRTRAEATKAATGFKKLGYSAFVTGVIGR